MTLEVMRAFFGGGTGVAGGCWVWARLEESARPALVVRKFRRLVIMVES
jgi:hypothetical protein